MFLGEYHHTVDPKGRIVLPSRFREQLAKGCVVTKGQEHCLFIFTVEQFSEEVERIRTLPRTDRKFRNYERAFFAGASDQKLDAQGRIQIPPSLREFAGLEKDVAIVGVGERAEIWNATTWQQITADADEYYVNIEEALSEQGI